MAKIKISPIKILIFKTLPIASIDCEIFIESILFTLCNFSVKWTYEIHRYLSSFKYSMCHLKSKLFNDKEPSKVVIVRNEIRQNSKKLFKENFTYLHAIFILQSEAKIVEKQVQNIYINIIFSVTYKNVHVLLLLQNQLEIQIRSLLVPTARVTNRNFVENSTFLKHINCYLLCMFPRVKMGLKFQFTLTYILYIPMY